MPILAVDFRQFATLTDDGLTVAVIHNGEPTQLLIQGVTLDNLANFAAAEHMR